MSHTNSNREHILDFYTQPAAMTGLGESTDQPGELPRDVGGLVELVQGLLLHEHIAPNYGVALTPEQHREAHIRAVPAMLEQIFAGDPSPLTVARPLGNRLIGTCRNFSVLLVALLRAQGIPARARCGFATYFADGVFVDHWVGEYWKATEARWVQVDAQLDELQRKLFDIGFDALDVPAERFLSAGYAWEKCRTGAADPAKFGIMHMHGLWFIAGNVVRDFAALNNWEMLPWDCWGTMPAPDENPSAEQLALLDKVAELSRESDVRFDELRELYLDPRLRVPNTIFNSVLNQPESIAASPQFAAT